MTGLPGAVTLHFRTVYFRGGGFECKLGVCSVKLGAGRWVCSAKSIVLNCKYTDQILYASVKDLQE